MALHFGSRVHDESRRLKWRDIPLEKEPGTENEILVWRYERGSKTCQGQDKPYRVRAFHPTVQGTSNEHCPVNFFKEFAPDSPFYLAGKHQ